MSTNPPTTRYNRTALLEPEVPIYFGPDNRRINVDILRTVFEGNELLSFPLNDIVVTHFPNDQLKFLSGMKHESINDSDKIVMKNASFVVFIGKSEAYDKRFSTAKKLFKTPWDCINIYPQLDPELAPYATLFTKFLVSLFPDDGKFIEETYNKKDVVTIAIFARTSQNIKAAKKNVPSS